MQLAREYGDKLLGTGSSRGKLWVGAILLVVALGTVSVGVGLWRARSSAPADQATTTATGATEDPAPAPPAAAAQPPGRPAPAARAVVPAAPQAGANLAEAQLMTRLRSIKDADPAAAIALAREGNRRFPDSADAPERSSILVHALAAQGEASQARGEAEAMVNHYPDSEWVREVEQFSGAHRHRNARVTDAGEIIYE